MRIMRSTLPSAPAAPVSNSLHRVALAFSEAVADGTLNDNATVKIGAWLIGAAQMTGGFPLELSRRMITLGFEKNGVTVEGTGSRVETVTAALEALENAGILEVEEGESGRSGHRQMLYTMVEAIHA
jgi:hypothetical protein